MVFCAKCNGSNCDDETMAFMMRISMDELKRSKQLFIEKGFINNDWDVLKWDKRQYLNDNSTSRVRKYRKKRKDMGLTSNGYSKHIETVTSNCEGSCVYCGSEDNLCIDHILPIDMGGDDSIENLALACKACNSGKSGRTPDMSGYTILSASVKKTWEKWMRNKDTACNGYSNAPEQNRTEQNKPPIVPLKRKKRIKKKFIPPTLDQVITFFTENGYTQKSAQKAFYYYQEGNPPWHDASGKPVKSWKQKMRGVWFKPENAIKKESSCEQFGVGRDRILT